MIKCPLCGYKFEKSLATYACRGCFLFRKCNLIKCPNCGYEFPGFTLIFKSG